MCSLGDNKFNRIVQTIYFLIYLRLKLFIKKPNDFEVIMLMLESPQGLKKVSKSSRYLDDDFLKSKTFDFFFSFLRFFSLVKSFNVLNLANL